MSRESLDRLRAERKAAAAERREERKRERSLTPTPVVTGKRLRCPRCSSLDLQTQRTIESEPEILSQRKLCRDCHLPFIAILD